MMPPVGCCTFLTLESTTMAPGAWMAPEISVANAQPPIPTTRITTTSSPPLSWPWIALRYIVSGAAVIHHHPK